MARTCSDCSSPITRQSKTGRCKPCALRAVVRDPRYTEKRLANLRKRAKDPDVKARRAESVRRTHHRKMAENPEYAERRRQIGREFAKKCNGIGNKVRPPGSPARMAVGQKLSDQRLGWCPREKRPFYHYLRKSKGMGREEAKQIILDEMAAAKASLSPFERQDLYLKQGCTLQRKQKLERADYDFTLGGIPSSSL